MKRRRALVAAASLGTTLLAGCAGSGSGDGDGDGDGTETATGSPPSTATTDTRSGTPTDSGGTTSDRSTEPLTGTDTPVETTTGSPHGSFVEATLAVLDAGCGTDRSEASVAFDAEAAETVVSGTIPGNDACHAAVLGPVEYDESTGALSLHVRTERDESAGETTACAECISEIDYEATVRFDGGLPGRVTVHHDGAGGRRQVADVERA